VQLPHSRLGIEATGVIDAIGDDVTDVRVGDPVIITAIPDPSARGSYAEYTTIPAGAVIPRPAGLDILQAAAVWVGFSTAYGALVEEAGLRPADRVLISGASGSVGRAAIQVSNRLGAVPIAITRHAAKAEELLNAGAAAVIATDCEGIVEAVGRLTAGAGVDMVLDLVRGPGQAELVKATRPGGRVVEAGFLDSRPTPEPARGEVEVVMYYGFARLGDPAVVARMAAFLNEGVAAGTLLPAIDTVFALDDIVDAHRRFDAGLHGGRKIVVAS
jgi:NADPH:quinone reductase-like Zn-dependent oxidoreductase